MNGGVRGNIEEPPTFNILLLLSNLLHKALWYPRRLASMSLAEIRHRIGEQFKRQTSRLYRPNLCEAADRCERPPTLPGLKDRLRPLADDDWLINQWKTVAERARTGRLYLLGQEWPTVPPRIPWHIDPVTHNYWPGDRYCFSIPYRHTQDMGDIKYVWELNRLQFLQPIAALASLEGEPDLARFCIDTLEDWIGANPPFKGVNWASGIELASRIVSILMVCTLTPHELITPEQNKKILTTLLTHGYWIDRYPSRFSSANNHLIAEAGGLYLLGILAPQFPDSAKWAAYGRRVLLEEVQKQIYEDGVGAEQSPTYTAFTLEWLLLCGAVAQHVSNPFPRPFWERIERAAEFLRWITDSNGNHPRIGDDDEGRVLYSHDESGTYVGSVLSCIASATERPDLAPPGIHPHLRHSILGQLIDPPPDLTQPSRNQGVGTGLAGNTDVAAARPILGQTPSNGKDLHHCAQDFNLKGPTGIRSFKAGGYTIARTRNDKHESLLVFDHGPVGYLSIAAHGHADALSIWFHVDGQPVIVDAGTYLYHAGTDMRDYFRSTPAHNTLSIDLENSSQISGPFNWSTKANARLIYIKDDPEQWTVEAEHDGYLRRFGVLHRRRVQQVNPYEYHISDSLAGRIGPHSAYISFLFHPSLSVHPEDGGKSFVVRDNLRDYIKMGLLDSRLDASIVRTTMAPRRGWYSERFGKMIPAQQLVFAGPIESHEVASSYIITP
jgi:uncharacterized heparinase superfamily protein